MLLVYFLGAIYYLENMFRFLCTGKWGGPGLLYAFLFSIPVAILCYLLCSIVKESKRNAVAITLMSVITLIFLSQFIYFKIFRVFYSLYSATNAGQAFEFWEVIVMKVRNNFGGVVILLIPLIILIIFRNKMKNITGYLYQKRAYLLGSIVAIHMITLVSLGIYGKDVYSPYDLYFEHNYPVVAAEKMGLITTMRLNLKRSLFDWSPKLSQTSQEVTIIKDDTEESVNASLETDNEKTSNKEPQILNIDFDKLINDTNSEEINALHEYFKNEPYSTKNDYTGKYKGYNLITITAEGFSPYAIRKDLTPTLYKMYTEGYQFENFYTPLWEVSTSDGEYAICQSLIPKSGIWSMSASSDNSLPFTLGHQLQNAGYKTMAFHNHDFDYYNRDKSHPNLGYIYEAKGLGLDIEDTWPESDVEMIEETVDKYVHNEPFHAYYMTVSGHMNYSFDENDISEKNKALVEDLECSDTIKAYLASQIELDRSIEKLLKQLEAAGVLDRTLITITPDHYPYGLNNEYMSELKGDLVDEDFELYRSALIMYTPNMEPKVISKPCSSLDILPTLSNLMGLDYDSRLFVGRDIFSDSDPLVMLYSHNFITDKGRYNALTKEFIEAPGADVDDSYVKAKIEEVDKKFYYSSQVLDQDYYSLLKEYIK